MANVAVGLMDDVILVKRTEWVQMMKKAHERGYPIGKSSAANLAAIEKVAKRFPQFKNIVTVFFDGKEKYASEFNLDAKADSHAKVDIRSAEQHAGAAWDELYRDAGFQLHTDTARLIKDIIPVLKKKQVKKILSVPCGDFINEAYLGKSGFAVDGIDAAPTAIRKSKERIKNQSILRCTARFGDIFKMKLRKRDYDAVIVHDLTMHLSNETCVTLLSKLSEVLKPDGLLIINFHSQLDETLKYGSLVAAYVRSVRDNKILIYYRSQHEIEHIFSASPFSIQKLFLYNRVDVHHNKFRVEEKKTHTHRPYCVIAEKRFSSVSEVVVDVKKGKPIIVVDNREQEGDLYVASEKVRPQTINEMLSVGRGVLCVSLLPQRFHELDLRSPDDWGVGYNDSRFGDPVDYLIGTTTGVSAYDRAATIRALTQAATRRSDLLVPGHVRTTESMKNGLKEREGHSEACVELSRIAGLYPSGTQIEIVGRNGKMADERGLFEIAAQKGYKMIQINQIKHYLYGVV